ncbi:hypothetical protein CIW83_11010 [Tissierella sp. P1]|uniref:hypothetical protein n=1 Tax=Tissierella sp. P1 TaxID=1280483 RepID=UPI000BA0AD11|nr:hypothetical protein [Tissierella sp. P1]MDU5081861.1 hypothetical protein [Bacillota bacterium]OZV12145.1 hypothetical protein CIW83_11010 [Tissierella sp. P1]
MDNWLEPHIKDELKEYYIRFDYLIKSSDKEKIQKMEEFKEALNKYFIEKHVGRDLLIDSTKDITIGNIIPEFRKTVNEIFDSIWNNSNKDNNIKGLLGETIATWLCETFDASPIYFLPLKRGNSSEQGPDRWELRNESGDKVILRIWSSKCTTDRPSSRADEVRNNDFSNIEVHGILQQLSDIAEHNKYSFIDKERIKEIKLSTVKKDSLLSFGVVMTFDLDIYNKMYKDNSGRPLNLFTAQPYAENAEKIVRFVPVSDLDNYIKQFEISTNNILGRE